MVKCKVYEKQLKWARATSGILLLIAFLLKSYWAIGILGAIFLLAGISPELNLFYRIFLLMFKREGQEQIEREKNELRLACGLAGIFTLAGFCMLYFNVYPLLGKIFILMVIFLLLLAGFAGICVASILYALIFKSKRRNVSQ
ncbi:MAG: DUF4395 family protein [Candidatus Pacebacteria bacterium]|nr:DUF4395 family protein [Candidatus Paceibacterota bacterium]